MHLSQVPIAPPPFDADAEARRRKELEDAARANLRKYEIVATTSNLKGAGTDCGVFLQVWKHVWEHVCVCGGDVRVCHSLSHTAWIL